MGYRARLGRIPKAAKEKYAGKSAEEVGALCEADEVNKGDSYWVSRPKEHVQLYELGKYCDFRDDSVDFYDFDIMEKCENEFHIMPKETLKKIIEYYHNKIFANYEELHSQAEGNPPKDPYADEHAIVNFLRSRKLEWGKKDSYGLLPYRLDEDDDCDGFISGSWQYEYGIFNIVHIYRTFDWENDYLIYSA